MGIFRVWVFSACAAVLLAIGACGDDEGASCGPGTELVGGECVVTDGGEAMAGRGGGNAGRSGSSGGGAGTSGRPAAGTDGGEQLACGDGGFVTGGACEPLRQVGEACDEGTECVTGTCLPASQGTPGGYCSLVGCSENRQCPAGSHCYFSATREQYLCLAYCDSDKDCRDDYVCQPLYVTDIHICAPNCTISHACTNASICDEESGKCVLRECDPASTDPCDPDDPDRICYPDSRGLSSTGGLCLPLCDPSEDDLTDPCASNEVCQPLPADPANTGFCAPPVCATTENCPAGAQCMDNVCQPPARCDADGVCADDTTVCVGGAGGQCMPQCPNGAGEACSDIHSGLSCATTLNACLPTGVFPGSPCRSDLNSPCSDLTVHRADDTTSVTHMTCEDVGGEPTCLASCETGGSELCADISDILTCADGIFSSPVCLPEGAFPGGPCDAEGACADLSTGSADIPMACERGKCLITCDDNSTADVGDQLCEAIDSSLICVDNLFGDGIDTCLPRGSFPGGPCAAGNRCDTGLSCQNSICLYQCTDTPGCEAISTTLACAVGLPGYTESVCLPKGAYPGGPCGAGDTCASNVGGNTAADMFCLAGRCLLQCDVVGPFANGDALCTSINAGLTCVGSAGTDFCAPSCQAGACPTGNSCFATENACLPDGTFPFSRCRAAAPQCDENLNGNANVDMECSPSNQCVISCETNNDALCGAVSAALTCSESASSVCLPACVGGQCPTGLSCLRPGTENACLPNGSFLGAKCAGGTTCSGSPMLRCVPDADPAPPDNSVCAAGCADAGAAGSTYCAQVAAAVGTTWDDCADIGGGLLICIDSTP